MRIDVPTLLVTLFAGFLMLSLQLWMAQRGTLRQPEVRTWAQGGLAMLGGFALLFLRPWMPAWVSILVGNALFLLSAALYSRAVFRYLLDAELPRFYWPAVGLCCAMLPAMMDWERPARTALVSLMLAGLLTPVTSLLLIRGWRTGAGSMRSVALMLVVTTLTLYLRSVDAMLRPEEHRDLLQGDLISGLAILLSFLCLLGAGFGFVLACFERVALRMETMATTDGLTGCLNRTTTDTLLAHTLERGRREGSPVAFCLLDIDHFKRVNDCHGHQGGDEVLRAFADAVRGRLRASDVLGRMGGEEFALVLPATDAPGALRLTEGVRLAVEQMAVQAGDGRRIAVTVSAGVVVAASNSGLSATRLYMLADGALYDAKRGGRNRVLLADPTATVRLIETIENSSSKTVAGNFS
ncbi:diguanylate cyclase [Pelomonas sp. KK5]|uniref:GGDEF domain-containing protein n=1 Tax=Pelomonas sp. KK5 TaxID=1855730 RepID=UPI00097BABE9|nr:GGDEF domain-containing protein [Pelomonas sp. KK5]